MRAVDIIQKKRDGIELSKQRAKETSLLLIGSRWTNTQQVV